MTHIPELKRQYSTPSQMAPMHTQERAWTVIDTQQHRNDLLAYRLTYVTVTVALVLFLPCFMSLYDQCPFLASCA